MNATAAGAVINATSTALLSQPAYPFLIEHWQLTLAYSIIGLVVATISVMADPKDTSPAVIFFWVAWPFVVLIAFMWLAPHYTAWAIHWLVNSVRTRLTRNQRK